MDQQGAQSFWIKMLGQRPGVESNSTRNPTLHQSDGLLDGEKTGAALLFTGVILALVGVTFTIAGWHHYHTDSSFEWTQLLGPILISVGGTFMLTSICKLGVRSCCPCEEGVLVTPVMEQTPRGHPCTLSGINQPIMLHSATTMVCIPPTYNFTAQEVQQAVEHQPGSSVNCTRAALPPRGGVYCVDNAAFTAEDSSHSTQRENRIEKTEDGGGRGSTCSPPPAYEDIYPSFDKHSLN